MLFYNRIKNCTKVINIFKSLIPFYYNTHCKVAEACCLHKIKKLHNEVKFFAALALSNFFTQHC